MACGYSKLEARDADHNAKVRFQFRPSQPEKRANMQQNSSLRLKKLNFATFWPFSQARMVEIENGLLHCDQHLELQVLSTHMPYFKEIYFSPLFRAQPFKYALSAVDFDRKSQIFLFWSCLVPYNLIPTDFLGF